VGTVIALLIGAFENELNFKPKFFLFSQLKDDSALNLNIAELLI